MKDEGNKIESKQVYTKRRMPVPIDEGIHQLLKIKAAKDSTSIKALLEEGATWVLKDETAGKTISS